MERLSQTFDKLKQEIHSHSRRFLGVAYFSSVALLVACGSSTPKTEVVVRPPTPQGITQETDLLYLPYNVPNRFTGGPHNSLLHPAEVRDSLDFAPELGGSCPPPSGPIRGPLVVATASGKVTSVGGEKQDDKHSIVEIQRKNGFRVRLMHLAEIEVQLGEQVVGGKSVVGKASCEVPKNGTTNAVHVHMSVADPEGKPIPIDKIVFSGWQVHALADPYQGTLTKTGEQIRTAREGQRCGPDAISITLCGDIRNDLNGPLDLLNAGFLPYPSEFLPYQIKIPYDWGHFFGHPNGRDMEVFTFKPKSAAIAGLVADEKIDPAKVNLLDYRNRNINEIYNSLLLFGDPATTKDMHFVPGGLSGKDVWVVDASRDLVGVRGLISTNKDLGWLLMFFYTKGGPQDPTLSDAERVISSIVLN